MKAYTHLTFGLEKHELEIYFASQVVRTFTPFSYRFHIPTLKNVSEIQEAGDTCCSTYVGSVIPYAS